MSRVLTDSLTLASAMYEKTLFSKQNLLFLKINYQISVKNMGLPSEANVLENFSKQSWSSSEMISWTVSQPHSSENHPVKFLSQPCSFFQKIHVMHSHLISRLPGAYENALCLFNHFIPIYIICIYSQFYNHTTCNSTISTITQISSFERITISSPMVYKHNYILYNYVIVLTH